MEIKLLKEELEYVPDGSGAFILNSMGYLNHYPELCNMRNSGKDLLFKIVKLKTGDIYYVADFVRTKAAIQPKIINHYKSSIICSFKPYSFKTILIINIIIKYKE